MKYLISFFIFISLLSGSSQAQDAMLLLDKIKDKYVSINDYQADVYIKVNVDFLKIPNKNAKVYFKKPDKFRMKTKGFALLPKKGVSFVPTDFIQGNYAAIESGKTEDETIIKVIPLDNESELVLSTLWIDTVNNRINKLEANTKKAGSFKIDIQYDDLQYDMPSQIIVSFDIKDFEMPISFTGEFIKKEAKKAKDEETKGSVTIQYSNYRINEGIDDKIFKKK